MKLGIVEYWRKTATWLKLVLAAPLIVAIAPVLVGYVLTDDDGTSEIIAQNSAALKLAVEELKNRQPGAAQPATPPVPVSKDPLPQPEAPPAKAPPLPVDPSPPAGAVEAPVAVEVAVITPPAIAPKPAPPTTPAPQAEPMPEPDPQAVPAPPVAPPARQSTVIGVFENASFGICGRFGFTARLSGGHVLVNSQDKTLPGSTFRGFERKLRLGQEEELWSSCTVTVTRSNVSSVTRLNFTINAGE